MLAKAKHNFKMFMETVLGELRMEPDVEWYLNLIMFLTMDCSVMFQLQVRNTL